jgi:putative acetyltransferase
MSRIIRSASPDERDAIYRIHVTAFGREAEANLVDRLRDGASSIVSLVAEVEGITIAHILFSPMVIPPSPQLRALGLAPLAVMPDYQRQGIGGELVRAGIDRCRAAEWGAIFVLGSYHYYSRFGFAPAANWGISCEYDVPPGAFMAMELQSGILADVTGMVYYHPAFATAT